MHLNPIYTQHSVKTYLGSKWQRLSVTGTFEVPYRGVWLRLRKLFRQRTVRTQTYTASVWVREESNAWVSLSLTDKGLQVMTADGKRLQHMTNLSPLKGRIWTKFNP